MEGKGSSYRWRLIIFKTKKEKQTYRLPSFSYPHVLARVFQRTLLISILLDELKSTTVLYHGQ
jgi:hypothetical protein